MTDPFEAMANPVLVLRRGWCRHCGYNLNLEAEYLAPWSLCRRCGVEAFAGQNAPEECPVDVHSGTVRW